MLGGLLYAAVRGGTKLLDIKRTLDRGENAFYGNLYMNNIPLEGLTMEQASQLVREQVDSKIASFRITLRTQDDVTMAYWLSECVEGNMFDVGMQLLV